MEEGKNTSENSNTKHSTGLGNVGSTKIRELGWLLLRINGALGKKGNGVTGVINHQMASLTA